jgi:hypothetical protein
MERSLLNPSAGHSAGRGRSGLGAGRRRGGGACAVSVSRVRTAPRAHRMAPAAARNSPAPGSTTSLSRFSSGPGAKAAATVAAVSAKAMVMPRVSTKRASRPRTMVVAQSTAVAMSKRAWNSHQVTSGIRGTCSRSGPWRPGRRRRRRRRVTWRGSGACGSGSLSAQRSRGRCAIRMVVVVCCDSRCNRQRPVGRVSSWRRSSPEDVPLAVELRAGDPVSELSQAGVAATSGAAVATVV